MLKHHLAEGRQPKHAKAFYSARNLLLSSGPRSLFSDKQAAINRRNDSHPTAKTFFCGLRQRFVRKKGLMSGEDLSLLVRWNGGGP